MKNIKMFAITVMLLVLVLPVNVNAKSEVAKRYEAFTVKVTGTGKARYVGDRKDSKFIFCKTNRRVFSFKVSEVENCKKLKKGSKVLILIDNMNTKDIEDDEILYVKQITTNQQ